MPTLLLITLLVWIIYSFYYWRKSKNASWLRLFLFSIGAGILALWLYLSFTFFHLSGESNLINRYVVIILAILLGIFVWRTRFIDKDGK
jgi:hypothetical protein